MSVLSSNPQTFLRHLANARLARSISSSPNHLVKHAPPPENETPEQMAVRKLYRRERITPAKRGVELLKTARLNKGMAFSLYERQYLGLHGLLPPAFMTEEQQAYRVLKKLREQPSDLARYVQLDGLQDRNEKLFYRVLCDNIKELMPIVYTPTVGQACQHFGFIYRNPKYTTSSAYTRSYRE
uniref:Malic domain-containing protein n=1 Tax=Steinernema glaseri TaxID=37863 RepID=A0A1I8ALZ6_9BILA